MSEEERKTTTKMAGHTQGVWRDVRESELSEEERKTTTKMAGHTQGVWRDVRRASGARRRGRPRQRRLDTRKEYLNGETTSSALYGTPESERDGEELPQLSPGIGWTWRHKVTRWLAARVVCTSSIAWISVAHDS